MRPADLAQVLRASHGLFPQLPSGGVGLSAPDDAAVVAVPDAPPGTPALVLTTDFFTPIVDDPQTFGRIAAINAISDVYAMGGTPRFALNLAAFPTKTLSLDLLGAILAGGAAACADEGVLVVGGHTIDDPEPKFGLAVIGTVDPAKVWRKRGARAGDALVLTKAIGTGILATAFKRDAIAEGEDAYAALVSSTTTSNRRAADVARAFDVHAATDVTGYGLLGHLLEMIGASQTAHADSSPSDVDVELDASSVPLLEGARALTEKGFVPGGSTANLAFAAPSIAFDGVDEVTRVLLADAQTS
ncbi:MAG: selenide, water dikinase SelD, partial [Polyangiales bacterium]